MGCFTSATIHLTEAQTMALCEDLVILRLSYDDVKKFYNLYNKIGEKDFRKQSGGSRVLNIHSLTSYVGVESTPFLIKFLSLFGPSRDNHTSFGSFKEFSFSLWNFLTIDNNLLGTYTYKLYENKLREAIDKQYMLFLLQDIYGPDNKFDTFYVKLATFIEEKSVLDFQLTQKGFFEFSRSQPALLAPVEHVKEKFIQFTFGEHMVKRLKNSRHKGSIEDELMSRTFLNKEARSKRISIAPVIDMNNYDLNSHVTGASYVATSTVNESHAPGENAHLQAFRIDHVFGVHHKEDPKTSDVLNEHSYRRSGSALHSHVTEPPASHALHNTVESHNRRSNPNNHSLVHGGHNQQHSPALSGELHSFRRGQTVEPAAHNPHHIPDSNLRRDSRAASVSTETHSKLKDLEHIHHSILAERQSGGSTTTLHSFSPGLCPVAHG